jgi:hypothetical protein
VREARLSRLHLPRMKRACAAKRESRRLSLW